MKNAAAHNLLAPLAAALLCLASPALAADDTTALRDGPQGAAVTAHPPD
jgi:hypothetical protein